MSGPSTTTSPGFGLLREGGWQMVPGERAALEGILSHLSPRLAIEIGTAEGGSLRRLAQHCSVVHSFDLQHDGDLAGLPGVEFHTGDSHALLPKVLAAFERDGHNVDFVLVDGDHTADGVRRDIEDLLASGALTRTVILAHDASNDEVRAGLEQVDYRAHAKVAFVDLDFVAGHLSSDGPFKNQLWGGFALIIVDEGATGEELAMGRTDMHSTFEVLRHGRSSLTAPPSPMAGEALPPRALPWTEALARWTSPLTRLRIQMAWERLPRRADLTDPRGYVAGLRLHRELFHQGYTMLYPLRGRALYRMALQADRDDIPGAFVDCGSGNGGSTALMASGSPHRHVWAFDSFESLPARSEGDSERTLSEAEPDLQVDQCRDAEALLREAVGRHVPSERLHVCAGWFEDTVPAQASEIGAIALLHCDLSSYDTSMLTLESLYPHVSPGGWIVIDDYGAVPDAGKATRDFRARIGDASPLIKIDQTGRYWRKPA